jgi:AraC family transcriptional regulator
MPLFLWEDWMNSAVERAITCIWQRYGEPLSLADIAESAILSRFHFSRLFKDATGVPPGRFLSAVRIYQAKRMLATTSVNVTDISFAVGFNSLGSFTNHFTDSVGISPSRFRRLAQNGGFELKGMPIDATCPGGTVTGAVSLPDGYATGRAYLGTFSSPIVQRRPVSAAIADISASAGPCAYRLDNVPEGDWFIHAVAVADTTDPEPWTRRTLLVGNGHAKVRSGITARAEISLRPRRLTDLPILLALPDLEPAESDFLPLAIAAPTPDARTTARR